MWYYVTALLLGFGWFAALLVPPAPRAWILGGPAGALPNLFALLATSLVTARLFKRWIASSRDMRGHLQRSLVIPWAACVIYLTVHNVYSSLLDFMHTGRINVHDALILYYWGLLSAVFALYVILPYSFLCQWLLNKISKDTAST